MLRRTRPCTTWSTSPHSGFGLHPDIGLDLISFDTLAIIFADDATVADANGFLADFDAHIVGAVAPLAPGKPAFLVVRLPTTDHADMDVEVERARLHPAIANAVQDSVPGVEAYNKPTNGNWQWDSTPSGGNLGVRVIRTRRMERGVARARNRRRAQRS